ncbi:MAG: hypothetical protein K6B14_01370 [Lachnospiraceae bacterium]|nr:hypothetical protein [Lachnospiraceae bacterium]
MDELQKKKQQEMLLRTETYKEALGNDSLIKSIGVMDMNFEAYDNKQLNENDCAIFRERLMEMMMMDDIAAEDMKAKYPDIFEEAMAEKKVLNTQASRSGISKAVTDITGSKKAHAQEKMEQMSQANKLIVGKDKQEKLQRLTILSSETNEEYKKMVEETRQRIKDEFSSLSDKDMEQRLKDINEQHVADEMKYQINQKRTAIKNKLKEEGNHTEDEINEILEKTELTEEEIKEIRFKIYGGVKVVDGKEVTESGSGAKSLTDNNKLALIRDLKIKAVDSDDNYKTPEEKEKRKSEIRLDYKRLEGRLNRIERIGDEGGPCIAKDALFFEHDYVVQIDLLTNRVEREIPKYSGRNLGFDDIHRDVTRWSSPLWHANEATLESCEKAFEHINSCVQYKDINEKAQEEKKKKNPDADVIKECEQESQKIKKKTREGVEYGIGRLELFEFECKELLKTLPSSLFGPRPSYVDLLANMDTLNEVYRKAQSLMNVGRLIGRSPDLMELVPNKLQFQKTVSFIFAVGGNSGLLANRGKQLDKLMREAAKKGIKPEDVKDDLPPMQTVEDKFKEVMKKFEDGKF